MVIQSTSKSSSQTILRRPQSTDLQLLESRYRALQAESALDECSSHIKQILTKPSRLSAIELAGGHHYANGLPNIWDEAVHITNGYRQQLLLDTNDDIDPATRSRMEQAKQLDEAWVNPDCPHYASERTATWYDYEGERIQHTPMPSFKTSDETSKQSSDDQLQQSNIVISRKDTPFADQLNNFAKTET